MALGCCLDKLAGKPADGLVHAEVQPVDCKPDGQYSGTVHQYHEG